MNEWSPGGTYRPVTPDQQNQMRSFRSHWDEQNTDKISDKSLIVNIRALADTRSRPAFQQRSQENISKTSLACNRIKKAVNGSSDPRFKRVISSNGQNDACVGTEIKSPKASSPVEVKGKAVKEARDCNVVDQKSKNQWEETVQSNKDSMKNKGAIHYNNVTAQEPLTYDSVQEQLNEVDKLSFNHDIVSNTCAKQSVSDCTINARNTSLVSEDLKDDYVERLHGFSSTTRVKKVQNWIAEQKPKLDKRQSVITVIGQTQGQSPLSSALHEIDQRRKLVKELDKYAICNKIIDSEKDREMNTLVAQINFLSPSGKLLYSDDKKYDVKDLPCKIRPTNTKHQEGGDKVGRHFEPNCDVRCDNDVNTEHDTSPSSSEESSNHSQNKSVSSSWQEKYDVKGKIRRAVVKIPYPWLAYFMIIISAILCWYSIVVFQRHGNFIFDLFPQKPKTTTWYEKVCYWIWEVFRPSGNYHRSSSWSPR